MSRRIAITGATGLIGAALCDRFASRGDQVHALARRPTDIAATPGVTPFLCDLPDRIDVASLAGCDAVIHAAYDTRPLSRNQSQRTNEDGTRRLLDLSRRAGIPRFIFISSIAAHSGARSYYGRSKLALERALDPARDLIIRPGLVLARSGGLFQRIVDSIRNARIVPVVGGRCPMQTVHIDDLTTAFTTAVDQNLTGLLTIAEPDSIPFAALLRLIAAALHRNSVFIPAPAWAALAALRAAEAAGLRLSVSSEGLLGLLSSRAVDSRADLTRLGLTLRPASQSIPELLSDSARPSQ